MKLKEGASLHEIIKLISRDQTQRSYVETIVGFGVHQGQADFYVRMLILGGLKPWRECSDGEKRASVLLDGTQEIVSKAIVRNWSTIMNRIESIEINAEE